MVEKAARSGLMLNKGTNYYVRNILSGLSIVGEHLYPEATATIGRAVRCYLMTLMVLILIESAINIAQARLYTFDTTQLNDNSHDIDISLLEKGGQAPGIYLVEVLVNNNHVETKELSFHLDNSYEDTPSLKTCLTQTQLVSYGVKVDEFPKLFSPKENHSGTMSNDGASECANLSAIHQASEEFDFYNQRFLLSIPQIAMRPKLEGIAPEELWNDGISAFLMNYRVIANNDEYRQGVIRSSSNSIYAQFEPGLNLGPWRFRGLTTWKKQSERAGQWQNAFLKAERGLNTIKSRLTLGEFYSSSDIFQGVPLQGLMLKSDESMVPSNQWGFAPVVRGIARTQARIEVKKNGYLIYSTTVAPGAFDLTDLPSSGSSGDLDVTIFESNGQRQTFTVPYTVPAISLRKGSLKYNITGGLYRSSNPTVKKALTGQISAMYGLPWNLTMYGGIQGTEHYQAGSLGMGLSIGDYGAISVDGTISHAQKFGQKSGHGSTWRVRYSKEFPSTNTGFTLTTNQFASRGFNSLSEVLDTYHSDSKDIRSNHTYPDSSRKKRSRTSMTINQPLGDLGYLGFSGTRETYWNQTAHSDEWTSSWGSTFKGISWSVAWSEHKYNGTHRNRAKDQLVNLLISIPLDSWLKDGTYATGQMSSGAGQSSSYATGITGRAFDNRLRWDVRERMAHGNSNMMNLSWSGTYGELNGGYSYSKNTRQINAGVAGGMVVHPQGITLGQLLEQTTALIETPGVKGVSVSNLPGAKTDFRGFTTYGSLTPYQDNTVSLNPTIVPADAEILQTDIKVFPTTGAIVPARFATRTGGKAVMTLTKEDGTPVPFGAVVSQLEQPGTNGGSGIVGGDGEVYITGLAKKGKIRVQWGKHKCHVHYTLPEKRGPGGVYITRGICRWDANYAQ